MTTFDAPDVAWRGAPDADATLVVLLHGRGSNKNDIIALADHLPAGAAYTPVRAPISEGGGYAILGGSARRLGRPPGKLTPAGSACDLSRAPVAW